MSFPFARTDTDFRNIYKPNLKMMIIYMTYCSIFIFREFSFHPENLCIMNLLDVVAHFIALF